ncbi:hypothetical protein [Brevibacillus dissolubilis]|uniref:hypothetical protein n=1 Tax=Brevibacillus dissolubilis TaxID=1844116 RepID=UPI001115EA4F|nr:hypothetical protein [Brevibacillus dissolubilis]
MVVGEFFFFLIVLVLGVAHTFFPKQVLWLEKNTGINLQNEKEEEKEKEQGEERTILLFRIMGVIQLVFAFCFVIYSFLN